MGSHQQHQQQKNESDSRCAVLRSSMELPNADVVLHGGLDSSSLLLPTHLRPGAVIPSTPAEVAVAAPSPESAPVLHPVRRQRSSSSRQREVVMVVPDTSTASAAQRVVVTKSVPRQVVVHAEPCSS